MHKLHRGAAPACLASYRHGLHNWGDVSPADKSAIWLQLEAMQGARCAYCEAGISEGKRHIEHFEQKSLNPRLTFQWSNLFGSCNRNDSCGRHKDHQAGAYHHPDLLKPDVDAPDHYLVFVADGTIQPRAGLSPAQARRAQETLRVFNLDARHGALRQMRENAVTGYLDTAQALWELQDELPAAEWQALLDNEVAAILDQPFATAIRHTLCRVG